MQVNLSENEGEKSSGGLFFGGRWVHFIPAPKDNPQSDTKVGKDLMFAVGLRRSTTELLRNIGKVGKDLMFAVGLRRNSSAFRYGSRMEVGKDLMFAVGLRPNHSKKYLLGFFNLLEKT